MTRQRQVFPRDTVAHLWANGAQDSARDSGGSFYFTGGSLYSYGSHFVIGHILGSDAGMGFRRVIWNDASYSNTTSKHQNYAWRALSREQSDKCLHVPSLNQDDARSIERALIARKLPPMAETLLREIRERVASVNGKRHGSGPFIQALYKARQYQETAQAFYVRAGRKYPLPLIPESNDDVPSDKQARAAWVLTFARVLIQSEYVKAVDNATRYLAAGKQSDDDSAQSYDDPRDGLRVVNYTYNAFEAADRECVKAQTAYAMLHDGKKSAAVNRILRELAPLLTSAKDAKEKADIANDREEFAQTVRRYYGEIARNRANGTHGNYVIRRTDADAMPYYLSRIGVQPDSVDGIAGRRMARIAAAERVVRLAETVCLNIENGNDYFDNGNPAAGKFADAAHCYKRALQGMREPLLNGAEFGAPYRMRGLSELCAQARERLQGIDAMIQAQNAQRIADWISGVSNVRPDYSAGTFARINGTNIETTRGASVPISHACRLARVFDRIVNAGGKTWHDGDGPMIGHYRVNHIGADGALIIGCHEFSSVEARRLRDVLNQCPECVKASADAEIAA